MPQTSYARRSSRLLQFIVIACAAFVVLAAVAGFIYQSDASTRDQRANPMPGRLVDVGGYRMHIDCTGAGSPTVILDSGLGDGYLSWRKVQPPIAQLTSVCSYDRAGFGYSDSSPKPRTSKVFAQELHTLLQDGSVPPPYVLVGHSMAGYDVRLFARRYGGEAVGMVLVDSSHPDQEKRLPPMLKDLDRTWIREQEFFEFTMPFGLPRLLGFCSNDAQARAAECNFHSLRESVAELKSISESAAQTAATGSLGDMPLVVLSQDPDAPQYDLPEDIVKPTSEAWQQMQKELAQLSTRSTQVIAKNSGHYIQLNRPDLVVDAIRQVIRAVRRSPTPGDYN
jgi:pimeloyl-ACP methyl ester carboxylesterase